MRVGAWPLLLVACLPPARSGLPPERFEPRPEWTPERYALPDPAPPVDAAKVLSADDVIDDVAYLQHALELAWADGPENNSWGFEDSRDRLQELAARGGTTAGALCESMNDWLNNTMLKFTFAGERCSRVGRAAEPDQPPLYPPVAGANYTWNLDGEGTDAPIGVLAIDRFAAPDDPGWAGFDVVLRDLAAIDLVLIDLRHAAGDDPRMGLAVLAALGLEKYLAWSPPEFRDGPMADVARANRARAGAVTPRSRALWSRFGSIDDLTRIAREHTDAARVAPSQVVFAAVVVGDGCEKACHMIGALAGRNDFHVAISGWAFGPGGDEPGTVRLPHSGIEVSFATAWYGGTGSVGAFSSDADPAAARTLLREIASASPENVAWRRRELPACAELPPNPHPSIGGCGQLPSDPDARVGLSAMVQADEDVTRRFLATCPGLQLGTVLYSATKRNTLITLHAPASTIARLASSPLPVYMEGECPMYPEGSTTE